MCPLFSSYVPTGGVTIVWASTGLTPDITGHETYTLTLRYFGSASAGASHALSLESPTTHSASRVIVYADPSMVRVDSVWPGSSAVNEVARTVSISSAARFAATLRCRLERMRFIELLCVDATAVMRTLNRIIATATSIMVKPRSSP